MKKLTFKVLVARVAVVSLCACAASFAQAAGNGNGGSGGGGAHGAATSGMTYHSEPISSPWNRVPGAMTKNTDMNGTSMPAMSTDDSVKSANAAQ